jgi:hypothetical protein
MYALLTLFQQEACHPHPLQFGTGKSGFVAHSMVKRTAAMANEQEDNTVTSLFSNAFLLKVTAFIGLLAVSTAGLTIAGKMYGDRLALDGHTLAKDVFHVAIGQDQLSLPANMIRFENQRHDGAARVINVYLSWPEMDGYTQASAGRFSDPNGARDLIFIEITQSVMSRDMSGRLEPIYKKLFKGQPEHGPAGLILHRLDDKSGFGSEVLLAGKTKSGGDYVVRCILPEDAAATTSADCQRDVHVGRDLTLLYRIRPR